MDRSGSKTWGLPLTVLSVVPRGGCWSTRWLHGGYTVVLHGGYTVVTWWLHGGYTVGGYMVRPLGPGSVAGRVAGSSLVGSFAEALDTNKICPPASQTPKLMTLQLTSLGVDPRTRVQLLVPSARSALGHGHGACAAMCPIFEFHLSGWPLGSVCSQYKGLFTVKNFLRLRRARGWVGTHRLSVTPLGPTLGLGGFFFIAAAHRIKLCASRARGLQTV